MLYTTSLPLRAVAQSCRVQQPATIPRKAALYTTSATLSTTSTAPSLTSLSSRTHFRLRLAPVRSTHVEIAPSRPTNHAFSRRAFTTSVSPLRSTSTASTTQPPPPPPSSTSSSTSPSFLPWHAFFGLRKRRRYISLASSVTGAALGFYTGLAVLSGFDLNELPGAATLGLDPFVLLGLETFACVAVGWLVGPMLGEVAFRGVVLGRGKGEFLAKEREFFARIKKHRADPANSSVQNPVPDYYGEKIGGVKDYRRWLKDQRAFNLKRKKNLI
ncbi:MAG: TIM23 complex component [Bathelium mastoideum]|nr:MAG: TIM23 complex component [Bathelium mastoideum]